MAEIKGSAPINILDTKTQYPSREDPYRDKPKDWQSLTTADILANQEKNKSTEEIFDQSGKKIATIDFDKTNGKLISVTCEKYVNTDAVAENLEEKVYITDEEGMVTGEQLTRAEAREQKKRYLIVSSLIFHQDKVLLQKRSANKQIDPDKFSTSAHGVAKEIFYKNNVLIENTELAALINTAIEINEELRHGEDPFKIRIWPGSHSELFKYAGKNEIDDPNTIWLVPQNYTGFDDYHENYHFLERSRAISAGFIFSKDKPNISEDPSEVSECRWEDLKKLFRETDGLEITKDLSRLIYNTELNILTDTTGDRVLAKHIIKIRLQGIPKERTD